MVEREIRKKLKCPRPNNGGEYASREFKTYYIMYGIRHEKTISTTLQHNGMAEMMNHSIIKSVKCMLKTTKLSKVF